MMMVVLMMIVMLMMMMVIVTDDDNNDYDDGDSDKYEKRIVQIGLGGNTQMESDTRFFLFQHHSHDHVAIVFIIILFNILIIMNNKSSPGVKRPALQKLLGHPKLSTLLWCCHLGTVHQEKVNTTINNNTNFTLSHFHQHQQ